MARILRVTTKLRSSIDATESACGIRVRSVGSRFSAATDEGIPELWLVHDILDSRISLFNCT